MSKLRTYNLIKTIKHRVFISSISLILLNKRSKLLREKLTKNSDNSIGAIAITTPIRHKSVTYQVVGHIRQMASHKKASNVCRAAAAEVGITLPDNGFTYVRPYIANNPNVSPTSQKHKVRISRSAKEAVVQQIA